MPWRPTRPPNRAGRSRPRPPQLTPARWHCTAGRESHGSGAEPRLPGGYLPRQGRLAISQHHAIMDTFPLYGSRGCGLGEIPWALHGPVGWCVEGPLHTRMTFGSETISTIAAGVKQDYVLPAQGCSLEPYCMEEHPLFFLEIVLLGTSSHPAVAPSSCSAWDSTGCCSWGLFCWEEHRCSLLQHLVKPPTRRAMLCHVV
jgi:hypothetical protein